MSLFQDDRGPPDAYVLSSVPKCSRCCLPASGCFCGLKAPLEQVIPPFDRAPHSRTSRQRQRQRPIPYAARRRWNAVLQGESDLAQLREIHPALLSIGVLNGHVCEQATDYFVKIEVTVWIVKMKPQEGRELRRFNGRRERRHKSE